eukprot:TRINITY_DN9723_c0_g1_i1.p1 TRINITY_DN9723_c0_g1~~TRINITY_DN9723_c0_g1_i1.p1  ORF type:complete len:512 (+),score=215.37 TRINITY_DN9723_c0_g1_i1:62-1537(+)
MSTLGGPRSGGSSSSSSSSSIAKKRTKKKPIVIEDEGDFVPYNELSDDPSSSSSEDEGRDGYKKGGYHRVKVGEVYRSSYIIVKKLGWGHFSTVWLARDKTKDRYLALKFVKSASHYSEAARDEIKLLRTCKEKDPEDKFHIVRMEDDFRYEGPNGKHIVMVFEVLGRNLLDLIESHKYGLPVPVVKSITKQILIGLDFLHTTCSIIHTDLKPENVLLVQPINKRKFRKLEAKARQTPVRKADLEAVEQPAVTKVKIADLGNACWVHNHYTDDIQTRQYRSPEAIVRYKYDTKADLWSLACMVFEMLTGDLLFKPKKGKHYSKSEDHLALILELLDQNMPKDLLSGKDARNYFEGGKLIAFKTLKVWVLADVLEQKYKMPREEAEEIAGFMSPMLKLHPADRASAAEMLQHPWLADADTNIPIEFRQGPQGEEEGSHSDRGSSKGSAGSQDEGSEQSMDDDDEEEDEDEASGKQETDEDEGPRTRSKRTRG